ncbi:LamG domain-containing protein [Halocatena marina]|uniref:LamG domain-containing protein n=1 Tax=Halocatena marina TaxID=2934937 RepID=UPI0022254821|nr:LamG domain-containing protein [Halocatena marina]
MDEHWKLDRRTAMKAIGSVGVASFGLDALFTGTVAGYSTSLESFYEFDDASPVDSSGNGNDGTVNGASAGATGVSNSCFLFDGIDDSIDVPHVLSRLSAGSYSVWVNADSLTEDRAILGDWDGGSIVLYYDVGDDVWAFAARTGGTIEKVTGGSPTTGSWIHLAVTYDGSFLKLYVDGTEVDSVATSGSFDSENVIQVGTDEANANDNHGYWKGRIDELRIYSRGLSSSEVSELYATPGSADLGVDTGSVTDIQYDYLGLAFDPASPSYSPGDEWIFPSIIETSNIDNPLGKYHLYTAPHGNSQTKDGDTVGVALFYSDTLDTNSWTEYADNPIIDVSEYNASHISSPYALYVEEYGKVLLYAHGDNDKTRWWHCSDGDGATFDYGGIAIDTSMMSNSSEASYARVYDYSIPDRNNSYTMFFMDNQGGTRHIRLATSDDAKNWTVDSNEVVTPQPQHDGNVSNPFFFKYDGDYLVAFHATSDNVYAMECGQNIDKENYVGEIMSPVSQDDGGVAGPFFIKDDAGSCYIYYVAGPRLETEIAYRKLTDQDDANSIALFDNS